MYAFGDIYFPLSIVLVMQHKFWYVLLSILFNTIHFVKFPLRLTFWSMDYLKVYCLVSKCLEISCYWLQIDSVMIRKYNIYYVHLEFCLLERPHLFFIVSAWLILIIFLYCGEIIRWFESRFYQGWSRQEEWALTEESKLQNFPKNYLKGL